MCWFPRPSELPLPGRGMANNLSETRVFGDNLLYEAAPDPTPSDNGCNEQHLDTFLVRMHARVLRMMEILTHHGSAPVVLNPV